MVEKIDFSDDADFAKEESLSIKEIILRHIRKISDISCKEFVGGWTEKKPIRTGEGVTYTDYYHDDVREAYCNAVDFLIDVLYPMGDEDFTNYLNENEGFNNEEFVEETDIEKKVKKKRKTFRQINMMFERKEFFSGTTSYNE